LPKIFRGYIRTPTKKGGTQEGKGRGEKRGKRREKGKRGVENGGEGSAHPEMSDLPP
jgi:hypothetical protein